MGGAGKGRVFAVMGGVGKGRVFAVMGGVGKGRVFAVMAVPGRLESSQDYYGVMHSLITVCYYSVPRVALYAHSCFVVVFL